MAFFNINGRDCNVAGLSLQLFQSLDSTDEERDESSAGVGFEKLANPTHSREEGVEMARTIMDDNYMPSFSSSHEGPRRLSWIEGVEKWERKIRNARAHRPAKWRSEDGKLPKRDSARCSIRNAQDRFIEFHESDKHSAAERFLDDNLLYMEDYEL